MKVLYLTYDGLSDPLGESQVFPYLSGLSDNGVKITLISFEKSFEREEELKAKCNSVGIEWHPLKYHKSPPVLSTVYDISKLNRLVRSLHSSQNFDIIHCRSYITALSGLQMKRKYQVPFLFDMRGFWADERVEGKIWNKSNPVFRKIYNWFKRKEVQFFEESGAIISLTTSGKEVIESQFDHSPIEVIPCCADLDLFKSEEPVKPSYTLGYIGSLGTWYMSREMLVFFSRLKKRQSEARFLIVTRDSPDVIWQLAEEMNLDTNSIQIVNASREEVPGHISQMEFCIMFILPVFSKKGSSPTKLAEIMAMNKPVICNRGVGDMDRIVGDNAIGIVVDTMTEEDFDNAIDSMAGFSGREMTEPRRIAASEFALEKGVELYQKVYNKMIQN